MNYGQARRVNTGLGPEWIGISCVGTGGDGNPCTLGLLCIAVSKILQHTDWGPNSITWTCPRLLQDVVQQQLVTRWPNCSRSQHCTRAAIIIIIIITQMPMFMVLLSWQSHCESSPDSFDECRTAPSGRWPSDQANQLRLWVCQRLPESSPTIAITS